MNWLERWKDDMIWNIATRRAQKRLRKERERRTPIMLQVIDGPWKGKLLALDDYGSSFKVPIPPKRFPGIGYEDRGDYPDPERTGREVEYRLGDVEEDGQVYLAYSLVRT